MAPSGPRQEAKLAICVCKMLTTSLTVLIFGSGKYRHYSAKLRMRLQVRQLRCGLFLQKIALSLQQPAMRSLSMRVF